MEDRIKLIINFMKSKEHKYLTQQHKNMLSQIVEIWIKESCETTLKEIKQNLIKYNVKVYEQDKWYNFISESFNLKVHLTFDDKFHAEYVLIKIKNGCQTDNILTFNTNNINWQSVKPTIIDMIEG